MKILIMSDSHKDCDIMLETTALEMPDYILHLGDHERDCQPLRAEFPEIPLRAVRGNCDGLSPELDVDEFVLGGKRFVMTHGHRFGVKSSIMSLVNYAQSRNADIVLYGHTHISYIGAWEKMQVINPGSIGYGRSRTYALMELYDGTMTCEIKCLENA